MVTGYIVDFFNNTEYFKINKNLKIEFENIEKTFVSKFNFFG